VVLSGELGSDDADVMVGLLNEDDNGRTDLGTLEKRLAEKNLSRRASAVQGSDPTTSPEHSQSHSHGTPTEGGHDTTPLSNFASPEPQPTPQSQSQPQQQSQTPKQNGVRRPSTAEPEHKEEEVEALSDMMCSLVTNNCGETRYIGRFCTVWWW